MTHSVAMVSGTAWYLWNFRRNVIEAFLDAGWYVHIVAGPDDWSSELAALPGVEVIDWHVSLDGGGPFQEFSALCRLFTRLRQLRPRMVFNNGIKANIYGGIASRLLGLPYVTNISGLGLRIKQSDWSAYLLARLYAWVSSHASALLVQNSSDLTFLQDHGLPPDLRVIQTMGSGVDLQHFFYQPPPPSPPVRVLFVGRLQEDKGIFDFISAAKLIKSRSSSVEFQVVGGTRHTNSGKVSRELLLAWERDGLADFVGHKADVRPYLARSHVLVMPSHGGEGLPKVILEAAASGRIAIVSDIEGCRDGVVANQTGYLVKPQDPEELALAIETFCKLPAQDRLKMSRSARARAEEQYSDENISKTCLDLLSLVEKGASD